MGIGHLANRPYNTCRNEDGVGEPLCWTVGGLTGLLGVTVFGAGGPAVAGAALLLAGSGIAAIGRAFRN